MYWQMATCPVQRPNSHQLQKAQTWIQLEEEHIGHLVLRVFQGVYDSSYMFTFPERTTSGNMDTPQTSSGVPQGVLCRSQ